MKNFHISTNIFNQFDLSIDNFQNLTISFP